MLWFNEGKDLGCVRTDAGERLEVTGAAFASGEKPEGRCAGKAIVFDLRDGTPGGITFIDELNPRRARMRHRR